MADGLYAARAISQRPVNDENSLKQHNTSKGTAGPVLAAQPQGGLKRGAFGDLSNRNEPTGKIAKTGHDDKSAATAAAAAAPAFAVGQRAKFGNVKSTNAGPVRVAKQPQTRQAAVHAVAAAQPLQIPVAQPQASLTADLDEPVSMEITTVASSSQEAPAPMAELAHKFVSRSHEALEKHRAEVARLQIVDIDALEENTPEDGPEYAAPSFEYMRSIEASFAANPKYMAGQTDINWRMRATLNDWLASVHHKFNLTSETLFLCVNIIDRYLSVQTVPRVQLQLVGVVALLLASKFEEIYTPRIADLCYMCEDSYTARDITDMEQRVIAALKFKMGLPTPIAFMRRVSKAENQDFATRVISKYLMEMTILGEAFIKYTPSLIAAASIWAARKMRKSGDWNVQLQYYSGYTEEQLRPCVDDMVALINTTTFRAIYKKYNSSQFYRASQYVEQHLRQHNGL